MSAGSIGERVAASELSEGDQSPAQLTLSRTDFLAKYATALQAIGDGEWAVPPDAWIGHMAVVAGYFDRELQARVREGLRCAIRWRRHCLAAKNHIPVAPMMEDVD